MNSIVETITARLAVWRESLETAMRDFIGSIPIPYIAFIAFVLAVFLFLIIRWALKWRAADEDAAIYDEHPTMVQGDTATLTLLVALVLVPILFTFGIVLAFFLGVIKGTFAATLLPVFTVSTLYFLLGLTGFLIWTGVSNSETVRVQHGVIERIHRLPIFQIYLFQFLIVVFRFASTILLLNFGWLKRPPLKDWDAQIRTADGNTEKGNKNTTVFNNSIDGYETNQTRWLAFRDIGHVKIHRKGYADALELYFLPKFSKFVRCLKMISKSGPADGEAKQETQGAADETGKFVRALRARSDPPAGTA